MLLPSVICTDDRLVCFSCQKNMWKMSAYLLVELMYEVDNTPDVVLVQTRQFEPDFVNIADNHVVISSNLSLCIWILHVSSVHTNRTNPKITDGVSVYTVCSWFIEVDFHARTIMDNVSRHYLLDNRFKAG
jgi:hypothetical protein